jgi:hypothetical protein
MRLRCEILLEVAGSTVREAKVASEPEGIVKLAVAEELDFKRRWHKARVSSISDGLPSSPAYPTMPDRAVRATTCARKCGRDLSPPGLDGRVGESHRQAATGKQTSIVGRPTSSSRSAADAGCGADGLRWL